jgi:hypothetical protein
MQGKYGSFEDGICYGDTYIGKSASAISFVQSRSNVSLRSENQQVTAVYLSPHYRETYKFVLRRLVRDLYPWVKTKTKPCRSYYKTNTSYWEQKLSELLSFAETLLIVIDEFSNLSPSVIDRLVNFIKQTPAHPSVVLVGYTPKIKKYFNIPVLKNFDRFEYQPLSQSDAITVMREWEKEALNGSYFDWSGALGKNLVIASEGKIGTLLRILDHSYHEFLHEKLQGHLKNLQAIRAETDINQIRQEQTEEEVRQSISFDPQTDIDSLTSMFLQEGLATYARFHELLFRPNIPEQLVSELKGDREAAIIVYTIRELDIDIIVSTSRDCQRQDNTLSDVGYLPLVFFNLEIVINLSYYREIVRCLGTTAQSVAMFMRWNIPDKYTEDGLPCFDVQRAKKKLEALRVAGYLEIKPGSVPNAYISREVYDTLIRRAAINFETQFRDS